MTARRNRRTEAVTPDAESEAMPAVEPETDEPQAEPQTDDATTKRHDETVPGGRYYTADGRLVNANGEPIEDGK